jgi:hypothetical protein
MQGSLEAGNEALGDSTNALAAPTQRDVPLPPTAA